MSKVGWYNVEIGHPVEAHAQMIVKRFLDEGLRWLGLTEVRDYLDALKVEAAKHGLHVVFKWERGDPATRNQAFLVRPEVQVGKVWSLTKAGVDYHAPDGGIRRAQRPLAAYLDGDIVVMIHAPVKAWVNPGWRFIGGLRRRASYRAFVNRIAQVHRTHPDVTVLTVGDWNCTPDVRGRWSPNWLRTKVKGGWVRAHTKTQGSGEIDFGILRAARGMRVTGTTCHSTPDPKGLPHSDHRLVTATYQVN